MKRDPRYVWHGEVSYQKARRVLAQSRLLVLSSRVEGGANVISEAIADRVPVLASHISGSVGLLGSRYPGFFPVESTQALASLLRRAENDPAFYDELKRCITELGPPVKPSLERASWRKLLKELTPAVVAR